MKVKFKKLSEQATIPFRAHSTDAGFDMVATNVTHEINECGQLILVYHTDIAMELPNGYVALLFPRSSICNKSVTLTNCVGVIDSSYRGEIMAKMRSTTDVVPAIYKPGDKFAQIVIIKLPDDIEVEETETLSESDRGEGGYGSTDNAVHKEEVVE